MQPQPSPIDPSSSLPSLLACLPTAFASPKPPPALLPILSPILRQRLQLLSEAASTKSWLPLLNWDDQEASQLTKIVESADLEPHPVSGEIEIESDLEKPKYRRIDEETLQALVNLRETGLAIVYVWATADGSESWKVSEVKPLHAGWQRNPTPWTDSIPAAEDAFESKTHGPAVVAQMGNDGEQDAEEEDDDDYWGRYDATPGRTPARTPPAASTQRQQIGGSSLRPTGNTAEDSYWGQYGSVQPALDAEDPDEKADVEELGQSTLDGNTLLAAHALHPAITEDTAPPQRSMFTPNGSKNDGTKTNGVTESMYTPNGTSTADSGVAFGLQAFLGKNGPSFGQEDEGFEHIAHPRPRSQSNNSSQSGKSALVEQLEGQAESKQRPGDGRKNSLVAEFAIQQHISTSMKSLFRLAKGAGMQRAEFERIVQNELGVLGILDDE